MLAPASRRAPGVRQRFAGPFGFLKRARQQPLEFYPWLVREFGDIARFDVGRFSVHVVANPAGVKHVLQDQQRNYLRGRAYKIMQLVIGEGLVTSEGDFWRRQRRLCQPAFQRQRILGSVDLLTKTIAEMLDRWEPFAATGSVFTVQQEMMRVALCMVARVLFSMDLSIETEQLGDSVNTTMEFINYRLNHLLAAPLWVPTRRNRRCKRAIAETDQLVFQMIDAHQNGQTPGNDLIHMLLNARDEETGEAMTERQLRDEIVTFLGAGHETTAVGLAWTWSLLGQHPEIERRLRSEVESVLGARTPTAEDVPRLELTRRVFEEAIRLYPPVWAMSREAVADDEILGFAIPARSLVLLPQFIVHRHPQYWDEPDRFDPDRFLPERSEKRPRYAYFPFALGPHQCIGNELALLEATLVLAMTMQRYRVRLANDAPIQPDPIFTLRPRGGVPVTIERVAQ